MIRVLFLLFAFVAIVHSQTAGSHSSVIGAGASIMDGQLQGLDVKAHGTLTQTSVGRLHSIDSSKRNGVGFWWRPIHLKSQEGSGADLSIPDVSEFAGRETVIPILLGSSSKLNSAGGKTLIIVIRLRRTLLFPHDVPNSTITSDGIHYTVRIAALVSDTTPNSTLFRIPCTTLLGDVESSRIFFDSAYFLENASFPISRQSGTFTTLGICKEGGSLQLVRFNGIVNLLSAPEPHPIGATATIHFVAGETGTFVFDISELSGKIWIRVERQITQFGEFEFTLNSSALTSGSYMLRMQSPTEVIVVPFLKD